jgi:hypothetical protein
MPVGVAGVMDLFGAVAAADEKASSGIRASQTPTVLEDSGD